ncbi:MAG: MlaA family lipoprotein [Lentisphaerales bacterium]|nr:MlaA family lipoprotein [Lentisphaerales bacterium]
MKFSYLFLVFLVTSCSSDFNQIALPESENPNDSALLLRGVADPIEPFNRAMFSLNKGLFEYLLYPTTQGYNYVMPEGARTGIKDFYKNLLYPVRVVNNALQNEWEEAWVETKRFGINTTVGFLGFTDPATDKYGIKLYDEDLGLTLGHYGWEPQMYIYLPFFGGSSERDVLGNIGDNFLDPASYFFPAGPVLKFNDISFIARDINEVLTTQYDAYELQHLLYSVQRRAPKYAVSTASEPESNCVQTIYAAYVKPEDNEFIDKATEGSISLEGFRGELAYNIWTHPEAEKTLYLLPGLGEHRSSSRIQALAELAYKEKYNVITFSSPFNFEFLKAAPKSFLAGYIEDDLVYIDQIIEAINTNVETLVVKGSAKSKAVMGMSLGAWYTMNLAARNEGRFEKFVVINPPVNLFEGLTAVDDLYRAPFKNNDIEEARKVANVASLKALASLTGSPRVSNELPFTHEEAAFLIGLNFRFTLRQAIFAGQYDEMTSFYESREGIYQKLSSISYKDYYDKMVKPALIKRGVKNESIVESVDIRNLTEQLKAEGDFNVFLSQNDFLMKEEYLNWFKDNFKGKVDINPSGGHLGNLIQPDVRKRIQQSLKN